jgi:radical SAM superfamily enzyme YgiQ (UPF0313 family)
VRSAGHDVDILDCEQSRITPEVRDRRLAEPWDVVGFQVFNNGLKSFRQLITKVKASDPQRVTLAGGPLASGMAEWLLDRHPLLDYVLKGEAEESIVRFLACLEGKCSPAEVPGLVYRDGDTIRSGPGLVPPALDRVLPPAWDLIRPDAYPNAPVGGVASGFPVGPLITSRGCPFACPYCAAQVIHGRGFRAHPWQAVLEEMRKLVQEYGVREIQILDDCFGFDREQAEALLNAYIEVPWQVPLSFPNGMRLDLVDPPLLSLLERAGTNALTFGIDFGSDSMLRRSNRRMSVADIRDRVRMIKANSRLRVTGNFILGHFDDSLEGMLETVSLACELPLDRAHFSAFLPIPGSRDWDRIRHEFDGGNLDIETMDFSSFSLRHPDISRSRLLRLKRHAMMRFYLHPRRLLVLIRDTGSLRNLWHLLHKARYHMR